MGALVPGSAVHVQVPVRLQRECDPATRHGVRASPQGDQVPAGPQHQGPTGHTPYSQAVLRFLFLMFCFLWYQECHYNWYLRACYVRLGHAGTDTENGGLLRDTRS